MNVKHLLTLQQVIDFLHGSSAFEPAPATQTERYQWMDQTLRHFRYASLSRADKGVLIVYLCRISGYSRQQITRLIGRYCKQGKLIWSVAPAKGFVSRYSAEDVRLLAEIDALHDTPSGPAVKKLCERAWQCFGDLSFERLAGISVAHLYNLRKRSEYRKIRLTHTKTRPVKNAIGVRRKPAALLAKGKQRKRYRYERMMTPYDKLKSLPNADKFLKPGLSFPQIYRLKNKEPR